MYVVFIFLLILCELFWEHLKYSQPEPLHVCKLQARQGYVHCMHVHYMHIRIW